MIFFRRTRFEAKMDVSDDPIITGEVCKLREMRVTMNFECREDIAGLAMGRDCERVMVVGWRQQPSFRKWRGDWREYGERQMVASRERPPRSFIGNIKHLRIDGYKPFKLLLSTTTDTYLLHLTALPGFWCGLGRFGCCSGAQSRERRE